MNTAELKQAYEQGATIEFNSKLFGWVEIKQPSFETSYDYRIASKHMFKKDTWYFNIETQNTQLFTGDKRSQGVDSDFIFRTEADWIHQDTSNWVELEENHWIDIMTKMLERNYGPDWKTIELERLVPFTINDEVYFNFKSNRIYNEHNCIFNQGVLARPKEDDLEIRVDITDLMESLDKISEDIKTSQKELQELKQEISEYKNWLDQVKIKIIKLF